MSSHYIEPATDQVIVAELPRETVIDGITLPDNEKQQEMVAGNVVFIGPDARRTKPSDHVLYGPYAGKHIVIDGMQFRILREGQIEAYIRKTQ
jgi:chaperonin GroES